MDPLSPNSIHPDHLSDREEGSRRGSESFRFFRWSKSTWRRLTDHSVMGLDIAYDDFLVMMRWPLVLGKTFGLIPLQGVLSDDEGDIRFSWTSLCTIYSLTVTSFIFLVSMFSFKEFLKVFFRFSETPQGSTSATKRLILDTREPLLLLSATLIYLTFISRIHVLIRFIKQWRVSSQSLTYKTDDKGTAKATAWTLVLFIIPGLVVSNLLQLNEIGLFGSKVSEGDQSDNLTLWEAYYRLHGQGIDDLIPYDVTITSLLFVVKNLANFACLFSDTCIICMSFLLYTRFQGVYEQARAYSFLSQRKVSYSYSMFQKTSLERIMKQNVWIEVRRNHLICLHLFWTAEELLSPLVFISYLQSTYLVSVQLHESVVMSGITVVRTCISWLALVYFVVKLIYLSVVASRINYYAHAIVNCIQNCPHTSYSQEVERLEYFLTTKTVGLSGLGCFFVTKSFLLSVASVVFTFEIILFSSPK